MKKMAISMVTALLLSACGDEPPKTIKDIDSHIVSATEVKDDGKVVLRIVWKLNGMSAGSDMSNAALGIERIIKGLVTHFPNQRADEVHIVLNSGLVDRYGNTSNADIYEIPFAMDEIRKINFTSGNFSHWDLLNLSGQPALLHPTGMELVAAYCKEENNAKYANVFCRRSLGL
ncbi:hypothetical protein [Burkholderia pseudomallei]|uniref:hypothetical protein n=1 Tax=Burkholderia pseudomallei TaxID=28450 RepID=UPI0012461FD3|nr:hypothetical protein [Burkholderia pseudomallei]QEW85433.1 hypothetical protein E4F34_33020 [Burkholderia pseudomallei]